MLFEARGRFDYDPNGGGGAIGTVRLDIRPDRVAIVRLVAIRTEYQRSGHGRVLLQKTEELGRSLDIAELRVYAAPEAAGFYEKLGYSRSVFDPAWNGGSIQLRKILPPSKSN